LAVTPTGHRLEYHDLAILVLKKSVRIEAGYALNPEERGTGLE